MPFDLRTNNLTGVAVIDQPAGVNATSSNFIDLYTYAEKYQPELIPQLHMAHGKGKITGLLRLVGNEGTYASDVIRHAEEARLHNVLKEVVVATPAATSSTFTSPTNHNVRVNDVVKISDGLIEVQATVTAVTNDTAFVASNDDGTAFGLTGNVSVLADFSNSWEKETENYKVGRRWDPLQYKNHTHIIKEVYNISGSDMVHKSWVMTPEGAKWYNHEIEKSSNLFDNKVEITHNFFQRKASGNARGMNGVVPQIETRGNIANEYITDIEELSEIARRAKQQGTCREFTIWADHTQMAHFRKMLAGVNAHYATGGNYGLFNNSRDMALALDFKSVYIDGCTFHFTPWTILEDPTLLGAEKFLATSLACLIVPTGNTYANEEGNTVTKPYLSVRYRGDDSYNRKREIKIFGPNGTAQSKDAQTTEFLSECLNQVIGANNFFVVRRGVFYS
ncbi:hypothetical protein [Flagellimonas nanhaiensis]|uniref:Major capsid protein n=1 Tax=Flagellimonas nanhaiensis TaxID=2292706 RepID=A0A371JKW9_9FLAO|nr:hypothetical protein [Allomuricauda nanhaiensis]RDY57571.1 hypothetical protein DX873_18610 [Allomuricauda nanhaiensis]